MKKKSATATTVYTYVLLTLAGVFAFMLPPRLAVPSALADPGSDAIRLVGTVRDLRASHPDFDVTPSGGYGHYAHLVKRALSGSGRPIFIGAGSIFASAATEELDLLAYWTLDDAARNVATDRVGANDAALENGPVWTPGIRAGALRFDGVDDCVHVMSDPTLSIGGDISIAGWFKLDADHDGWSPTTQVVMEKHVDDLHDTTVALVGLDYGRAEVPRGALVWKVEHGGDHRYKWTNRTSWQAGVWYHFAVVLNSRDSRSNRVFVNGTDDSAHEDIGSVSEIDLGYQGDLRIGGRDADSTELDGPRHFRGIIDDVMLFRRMLSEDDFLADDHGYRVSAEWRDSEGRYIAPHLAGSGIEAAPDENVLLVVQDVVSMTPQDTTRRTVIEGWGHTVTTIDDDATELQALAALSGQDVVYISDDVDHSAVGDKYTLVPVGVVNEDRDLSDIELEFSASRQTWLGNAVTIVDNTHPVTEGFALGDVTIASDKWVLHRVNGGQAPGGLELAIAPAAPGQGALMVVERGDLLYGGTPAPARRVRLPWGGHPLDFGTLNADGLTIMKRSIAWAAAGNPPENTCGELIADIEGVAGIDSNGAIESTKTFFEWFTDDMGTNLSTTHAIVLERNGEGLYEYIDDEFHPVDGQLLGNEGEEHNHFFTYEVAAEFVYDPCVGQFVEFAGADDAWLFIDGRLVMDLGGVLPGVAQHAEMDRLGLEAGEIYRLTLFYAQRQRMVASFNLRTNIELLPETELTVSAAFD